MVGVVAHQSWQIERGRKAGLALRKQITEALIGVFGGAEAGELAHRPEPAAMHCRVNAARVRWLARVTEIAFRTPVGKIGGRVESANRVIRNCCEFGLTFRTLCESWSRACSFPRIFLRRMDFEEKPETRSGRRFGCRP